MSNCQCPACVARRAAWEPAETQRSSNATRSDEDDEQAWIESLQPDAPRRWVSTVEEWNHGDGFAKEVAASESGAVQPPAPEPLTDEQIDAIADELLLKPRLGGRIETDIHAKPRRFAREIIRALTPPASEQSLTDERARFETWARSGGINLAVLSSPNYPPGTYADSRTDAARKGWSAALALSPSALTDEQIYEIAREHEGEYGTDMLGFARAIIRWTLNS